MSFGNSLSEWYEDAVTPWAASLFLGVVEELVEDQCVKHCRVACFSSRGKIAKAWKAAFWTLYSGNIAPIKLTVPCRLTRSSQKLLTGRSEDADVVFRVRVLQAAGV